MTCGDRRTRFTAVDVLVLGSGHAEGTRRWVPLPTPEASRVLRVTEHAVLVHIPASDGISLDDIEDPLFEAIDGVGVGELEGNEISVEDGSATLYMYGPDADRLYEAVEPVLRRASLPAGTVVVRSFGGPGAE
jgi:hypothetical protein